MKLELMPALQAANHKKKCTINERKMREKDAKTTEKAKNKKERLCGWLK